MRAINLIPADERRGAGGAAGRSGGGVYVVLGVLALLVVMAGAYVVAGKSVTDKQSELAQVTRQAETAEAQAKDLTDYSRFASLRQKRVQTVKQLTASRFDWSHALHEVARVLPKNAWLTTVTGTTSPGGSAGGGNPLRSALAVPALEIQGCTTSQASVARMMARMRLIDGVQRVSLSDADKGAKKVGASAVSAGGSSSGSDCRGSSNHFPLFNIVVFFDQPATPAPAATAGATQTAAATGAASSTTPATTASPSTTTPSSSSPGGTTP